MNPFIERSIKQAGGTLPPTITYQVYITKKNEIRRLGYSLTADDSGNIYVASWSGLAIRGSGASSFSMKTTANGLGNNLVWATYASGSSVYAATKFAVNAFSDGLRQELASKHVRVSIVAPGFTESEMMYKIRPDLLEKIRASLEAMPSMTAAEVAETVTFCVTRPAGVAISDLLVRPTEQER